MTATTPSLLRRLLGLPPEPPPLTGLNVGTERDTAGVRATDLTLESADRTVPALRLDPTTGAPRRCTVIYCHAHGHRYDIGKTEMLEGRPALLDPPLGLALARAGHRVICADMPGFGARQQEGTESALAKAALWQGRTLLGEMLDDLALCHAAMGSGPVATVGISMGATLAYWYAALTPHVAACAHLCAFADMAPLVGSGAHDRHGIYMTVPGLLTNHDMHDVAALIAPRPQLVCSGAHDPLTPPAALVPALAALRHAYGAGPLSILTESGSGHEETPAMRRAVLDLLARIDPGGVRETKA